MRTYLLWLRYDGTQFHGWQRQLGERSVQGELEAALTQIAGTGFSVCSSSRTDAGVHAARHPVSVRLEQELPAIALRLGVNSLLPHDVSVMDVVDVPPEFSVRKMAIGKTYRYQLQTGPVRDPFHAPYSWHLSRPLDVGAMREASLHLLGEHDFSAFRASHCDARSPLRRVNAIEFDSVGPLLRITICGNAFLRNMVRIMVGTLVDVGRNRQDPDWCKAVLESGDRKLGGQTAPSRGLFLVDVEYPPDLIAFGAYEW